MATIGEPGGNGNRAAAGRRRGDGTTDQQVQALLTQALEHFASAQEALKAGNLALYQQELEQAQSLIEQANQLVAGQGDTAARRRHPRRATPTPSASASRVAQPLTLSRRSGTRDLRRCLSHPSEPSAGARSSPSSSPATA